LQLGPFLDSQRLALPHTRPEGHVLGSPCVHAITHAGSLGR
jgi:hypothetical protein